MIETVKAAEVAYICDATGQVVRRKEIEGLPGGWYEFDLIVQQAAHKNFKGDSYDHALPDGGQFSVQACGEIEAAAAICLRLGLPAAVKCLRAGVRSGYTAEVKRASHAE